MAKKVQREDRADVDVEVEVEVVGVVKHDGDYVEPGTRIMLTDDQAKRLIASGHVKAHRPPRIKSHSADGGSKNGGSGPPTLEEGTGAG